MATYEFTVDPNGGSDFPSMALFVAGVAGQYSAGDIVRAIGKRNGPATDTSQPTVSGMNSGVIPQFVAHPDYWTDGTPGSGYVLENYIYARTDGFLVAGLEITGGIYGVFYGYYEQVSITVISNLIHGISNGSTGHGIYNAGARGSYILAASNLILDCSGAGVFCQASSETGLVANNVIRGCNTSNNSYRAGIRAAGFVQKNNCVMDNNYYDFYDSGGSGSDYNISSDSTAPGSNSLTNQLAADVFQNLVNYDYTLAAGSPALDFGANLSAYFTTDILGNARPSTGPWDAGAFQTVVSSGSTVLISGTIDTASDAAGDLFATRPLGGFVQTDSLSIGGIDVTRLLAGAAQSDSNLAAAVSMTRPILGLIDSDTDFGGRIQAQRTISGTIQSDSDIAADAETIRALFGSVPTDSSMAANIAADRLISGSFATDTDFLGAISLLGQGIVQLSGSIESASDAAADVTALRSIGAALLSSSNAAAAVDRIGGLSGAIATATDSLAVSPGIMRALSGSASSDTDIAGCLSAIRIIAGKIEAITDVLAAITEAGEGTQVEVVELLSALTREINLASRLTREVELLSALTREINLPSRIN